MTQTINPGFVGKVLHFGIESMSRSTTYETASTKLQASAQSIANHLAAAADTPANRALAAHTIGIERWAQRRLRTALGEALIVDEYDGYRPGDNLSMGELREAFLTTRADSVKLVEALRQAGVALKQTIPHNDMGQLSVRGWLKYMDVHASREAMKTK